MLDVGAGAGRVALDLARRGVEVVALDRDAVLLAALRERAAGLPVTIVKGDAGAFQLGPRFALVLGPMQTVQLLRGPGGRARFLRRAARHLRPGVLLAAALAEELEDFSPALPLPPPDMARDEGWTWTSQPTGLRGEGPAVVLERVRETVAPDRRRSAEHHAMRLDRLTARVLEEEATAAGLRPLPRRATPATEEHVGRTVVVVRG